MKISTLARHIREGSKSVIRNGWMTFASVSSISISLFILGVFLILTMNVNYLAEQVESQVEIRVYLELETPAREIEQLEKEISGIEEVSKITFISKEEALEILREKLGEDGKELLEGLEGENNPLNDSFTVEVKEPRTIDQTAKKIEEFNNKRSEPIIEKVDYGQGTVETLFKVTKFVRNVGLVLVAGLAFTAMFLISNTIRLTIFSRRKEIAIMKMVGATNAFIRWPFFVEGALLGLVGSLIPVGVLVYGYVELLNVTRYDLGLMLIELMPVYDVAIKVSAALFILGVAIGIWGSTISVRKYLKV